MTKLAEDVTGIQDLRWCVGKFVYVRGADRPMHFMELKSFIIEDAIDYSHLFYLRGLRYKNSHDGTADDELTRWMGATAVKHIAECVAHLIKSRGFSENTLIEWFPGVGLTGEYVQYLLQQRQGSLSSAAIKRYEGRGPAELKNQFIVLQSEKETEASYSASLERPSHVNDAILIINLNHSIKYTSAPEFDLVSFLQELHCPVVIAMRADAGAEGAKHTTVKGREISLPPLSDVLEALRASKRVFDFKFIENFDAGFFLPVAGRKSGLVLAYAGDECDLLQGFQKV